MKHHNLRTEQGVTLVELLVVMAIMGVVLIPVTMLMYTTLYTQKEVSERNELQHEAQLIMEQITSEMKNGAEWCQEGADLVLRVNEHSYCTGDTLLRYQSTNNSLSYVKDSANILLSANIKEFTLTPPPPTTMHHRLDLQAIHIVLEKNERSYEFTTTINYQRF